MVIMMTLNLLFQDRASTNLTLQLMIMAALSYKQSFFFSIFLYLYIQGFKSCLTFDWILKQGQVLQGHPKI